MEQLKDNSGCSGPKKSEIFWNYSRKVQYVFAGAVKLALLLIKFVKYGIVQFLLYTKH